jgi:hypothetical protein
MNDHIPDYDRLNCVMVSISGCSKLGSGYLDGNPVCHECGDDKFMINSRKCEASVQRGWVGGLAGWVWVWGGLFVVWSLG